MIGDYKILTVFALQYTYREVLFKSQLTSPTAYKYYYKNLHIYLLPQNNRIYLDSYEEDVFFMSKGEG